eukprot:23696-Alexandrium_andersonii.AAC.1
MNTLCPSTWLRDSKSKSNSATSWGHACQAYINTQPLTVLGEGRNRIRAPSTVRGCVLMYA